MRARSLRTRLVALTLVLLAAAAIVIGLVTALAVRLMTSLLFGVSAIDPVTYAGVAAGLIGAALLACYVPAARAAVLSPVDALRAD